MPRFVQPGIQAPQAQIQTSRFQQANPEDMGEGLAQGMAVAGQGAQQYSSDEEQIAQDKAQIWAVRAGADATVAATGIATQMQGDPNFFKKYGEDGSGYAEAFQQKFQDYSDGVLGQAPTPAAQRYLGDQLENVGKSAMNDALRYQASVGSTWATNNIQQTLDAYGRSAANNPQHYGDYLGQLQTAIKTVPYLSAQARNTLLSQSRQKLAFGAAMGWARNNPEQALGTLKPDTLAQFVPTPRVKAALANGQNVQLPNNLGGDLVKPYTPDRMQQLITEVKTPNAKLDPIYDRIGKAYGIDPTELKMFNAVESDLGKTSKNLGQIQPGMVQKLGVENVNDPSQNIVATAQLLVQAQKEAGGDTNKLAKIYYGGANPANWGANTLQYAENVNALQQSLHGDVGANPASTQDVLAMAGNRDPVNEKSAPAFFNDLSWQQQYETVMAARQGVMFNQTRALQLQTYAVQQKELAARKFMSDSFGALVNKTMKPQDIIDNPNLSFAEKKTMMDALHSDLTGAAKDDPQTVNNMYEDMQLPLNDPHRISTEGQLWAQVAKGGLSAKTAIEMAKYLQMRQGPQGEVNNQMLNEFMKNGENVIAPKNAFTLPDPTKEQQVYYFKAAVHMAIENGLAQKKTVQDMLNPKSKDYIGWLIDKYRTGGGPTSAATINPYLNGSGAVKNADGTSPAQRPIISSQKEFDQLPHNSYYYTAKGQLGYKK